MHSNIIKTIAIYCRAGIGIMQFVIHTILLLSYTSQYKVHMCNATLEMKKLAVMIAMWRKSDLIYYNKEVGTNNVHVLSEIRHLSHKWKNRWQKLIKVYECCWERRWSLWFLTSQHTPAESPPRYACRILYVGSFKNFKTL